MKLDNYHKIIKNTSPELKKRVKEMMDRLDDDYDIHVPLQSKKLTIPFAIPSKEEMELLDKSTSKALKERLQE